MRSFLPYFRARFHKELEEKQFRIYVGDSLHLIPQQKAIAKKYSEMSIQVGKKREKEKTGDEIAIEVVMRLGLKHRDFSKEKEGDSI